MTPAAPDPRDTEHGTTDPERVSASIREDDARWTLSYRDHTATALHRRAIAYTATTNGTAKPFLPIPTRAN